MAKIRDRKRRGNAAPSSLVAAPSKRRHPEWKNWRPVPQVTLGEALALSCNISPDEIGENDWAGIQLREIPPGLEEFARRLWIVLRNAESGHLPVARKIRDESPLNWSVDLSKFAAWVEGVGWKLPAKFPRPKAEESPKSTANGKPAEDLTTKERTSLLVIVGALAEIAKLDLSRHSVAAKTIVDALAGKGVTIGVRTVEEHLKGVEEALDRKG